MPQPSILCIDDDENALKVAEATLRRLGHDVIAASDAREAIQLFRERVGNIKLVMADIVMPEITGTALAKAVHAIAPHIPVILFTGYQELVSNELTAEALEAGIKCIVPKPFTRPELQDAIAKALQEELRGDSDI